MLWPTTAKASTNAVCDTHQVNGGDQAFLMNLNTPLEFGGTVYNGNVFVSPKGTMTFGQGDFTFWDFPQTPSISIASWDYHAFATGTHPWAAQNDLYVRYGSTATSICVDWKVLPWGQSSGAPVYIRLIAEVNPVNYTWTPTFQVSSNAPAGARYGVRYTQGGEVFPLTIQTITTPPEPAPVVPPAPTPTPSPTPEPEPTPSPTQSPEPSPSPTPEITPEPSPEPTPLPEETVEPTPAPVVPSEPVLPPATPVVPDPEPSLEPEPVVLPIPELLEPTEPEQPTVEPEELVEELSPEPNLPIVESEENFITSAEELPDELSPEELMQIDLNQIEATDLSEAQVEALIEAALAIFETAEPGSEEYEQALDALFLAAQADDIVLDEALAAIPLLGDVLGGALDAINFLGNAGADMSPEVREDSEKVVITAIVAVQAALSAISISGIATTINLRNGA